MPFWDSPAPAKRRRIIGLLGIAIVVIASILIVASVVAFYYFTYLCYCPKESYLPSCQICGNYDYESTTYMDWGLPLGIIGTFIVVGQKIAGSH